ncbi:MAG: glucosaminidase domain-containing protein [Saprospiraceae bacterium]|nr:glucosaminidase domain-containing protein [Saprospiraceae bacterium]
MLQRFTPLTFDKQQVFSQTSEWAKRNWLRMLALFLIAYVLVHKDLNLQLNLNGTPPNAYQVSALPHSKSPISTAMNTSFSQAQVEAELTTKQSTSMSKKVKSKSLSKITKDSNPSNTYSNMTYSFGSNESSKSKTSKRKKQEAYVNRFVEVAQKEMRKYGIPASITLAQGLIETNAGDSRLAKQNNNHFGMKCFSKKCGKGHCANFTDDSHKDFFRKYKSSWESYRAHSQLLMGRRYRHLKKLGNENYRDWARGLKKAGYATDKHYAEKLINIIDELKLYKFDNE